jgi:hypothetical protein
MCGGMAVINNNKETALKSTSQQKANPNRTPVNFDERMLKHKPPMAIRVCQKHVFTFIYTTVVYICTRI